MLFARPDIEHATVVVGADGEQVSFGGESQRVDATLLTSNFVDLFLTLQVPPDDVAVPISGRQDFSARRKSDATGRWLCKLMEELAVAKLPHTDAAAGRRGEKSSVGRKSQRPGCYVTEADRAHARQRPSRKRIAELVRFRCRGADLVFFGLARVNHEPRQTRPHTW